MYAVIMLENYAVIMLEVPNSLHLTKSCHIMQRLKSVNHRE
jgi:hypothetical protein